MCGITAIISKDSSNIISLILRSIEILQNRGYDSMGLSLYSNTNSIYKTSGTNSFKDLETICSNQQLSSSIAIAHTRWATHGGVNITNSHPHISNNQYFTLVHNGIIENYKELRGFLLANNYSFYSETDSEIIVNLIEYYYVTNKNNDVVSAINMAISHLEGTWGLVILCRDYPNNLYVLKSGSPILIGSSDKYIICTSESSGFIDQVNNYINILDNTVYCIDKNFSILNNNNKVELTKFENLSLSSSYPHWTLKEIHEQPFALERAMNYGARIKNNVIHLGGLIDRNFKDYNNLSNLPININYNRYYFWRV